MTFNERQDMFHRMKNTDETLHIDQLPFVQLVEKLLNDDLSQLKRIGRWKVSDPYGIDMGGVARGYVSSLAKEMMEKCPDYFVRSPDGYAFFSPSTTASTMALERTYQAVGRLLGICLNSRMLLSNCFSPVICKILLMKELTLDDVKILNPDVYRTIEQICVMSDEEFDLCDFSFQYPIGNGLPPLDLVELGCQKQVLPCQRMDFLEQLIHVSLCGHLPLGYFLKGFYEIVKPSAISLFSVEELHEMVCSFFHSLFCF